MTDDKTSVQLKLDERNHVEKPLFGHLHDLGWEIIDLDGTQHPADGFRLNFAEALMLPVLRERIKIINDWMEDDQVEEVVKQLTASFPGTGLIQNNRHVFTSSSRIRASARTAGPARKARPFALSTSAIATITALSLSVSPRYAYSGGTLHRPGYRPLPQRTDA
jgi:hypothetical protein